MSENNEDDSLPIDQWLGKPVAPPMDEDRPTLGQRIAGDVPKPQPAPTQAADAAPPPPTFEFDPSKLPDAIRPVQPTPNQVPQPPTGSNNPNLTALAKQQADFGKPIDKGAIDPKTGKPMYKMGVGQRILQSAGNFLRGFGGHPGEVVDVGPGATNWKFGRDEATREANLANVNTQIGTQEKLDSENEKMYRDAIKQAYEGQLGDARGKVASAADENATTKASLAQSQRDLNEARANKADTPQEPKTEAEIALAYQTALLKKDPKAAIYKGALDELRKQKAAGKDTTAGDIAKALMVAKFRSDEHDKVFKDQEAEREKRYKELDSSVTLKYNPSKLAAAKQQIDQQLETKYAPRHQKADADADQMLSLTKSGAPLKTGNQAPSKPTPSQHKVGDSVTYKGKSYKVKSIRPDGKLELGE